MATPGHRGEPRARTPGDAQPQLDRLDYSSRHEVRLQLVRVAVRVCPHMHGLHVRAYPDGIPVALGDVIGDHVMSGPESGEALVLVGRDGVPADKRGAARVRRSKLGSQG
jgi:hypothetical protein